MKLINKVEAKELPASPGQTILDHALRENLEWGFSCIKGTCARCRCLILNGQEGLEPPTDMEEIRLTGEELEQGFRLGCQAIVKDDIEMIAQWKPYF
jgi:2Fe-2S ferredoxin